VIFTQKPSAFFKSQWGEKPERRFQRVLKKGEEDKILFCRPSKETKETQNKNPIQAPFQVFNVSIIY
jgi:hypothetical protein